MIEKIAFNLGRNDEKPNIDLAIELINFKVEEIFYIKGRGTVILGQYKGIARLGDVNRRKD